jgi:FKBP-type peptidyl-prolyl cis-trans isomerase FklB
LEISNWPFFHAKDLVMKLKKTVCWTLLLTASLAWSAEPPVLKTDKDRLSYAIGASIGKNLKTESTEVDLNLLLEGIKANLAGDKMALTDREVRQVMNDYQTQMRQRAAAKRQLAMADNKKSGEAFLAAYKAKAGVQAMPSGVLYEVLKEGTGKKPVESDTVVVNYRGALVNNAEFDSTPPGKPAELKVASVISGWKQALAAMPVGSKWHVVIPSQLAYGERGVGNDIGPNEVLVFDVELVAIK